MNSSSKQKQNRKRGFSENRVENTASEKSKSESRVKRKAKPKGKKSSPVVVAHNPVRCPNCGSTERSAFQNVVTRQIDGVADGVIFDHVVWKRCGCKSCGQKLVVKYYENRVTR